MKKVGIIGSGVVGKALAQGFKKYGYDVSIASRSEEKRNELKSELGEGIQVKSPDSTAKENDIIVFAVKGNQAEQALRGLGADALNSKTVIDATNPIADAPPQEGVLVFSSEINKSNMEKLQEIAPGANFVKAFSCVGSAFMVDPDFESKPSMFICGNNQDAKAEVGQILDQFGWEVEDMGSVEAARAIEPLAMLWCIPGIRNNEWSHAFKLLKK